MDLSTYDILFMKVKFERNEAFLEVTDVSTHVIVLDPKKAIAILDIRSLGYHKIQWGDLHQRLSIIPLSHCKIYLKNTII